MRKSAETSPQRQIMHELVCVQGTILRVASVEQTPPVQEFGVLDLVAVVLASSRTEMQMLTENSPVSADGAVTAIRAKCTFANTGSPLFAQSTCASSTSYQTCSDRSCSSEILMSQYRTQAQALAELQLDVLKCNLVLVHE